MANINIDRLAAEIVEALATYTDEVVEKIDTSSLRIGKEAVKKLKQTSPKESGDYAKSWDMKSFQYYGEPAKRVLYVKAPHHRLAHLLEHGHAKVNGGRVEGIPHIRQVEQEVIAKFTREVEEAIRDG